MLNSRSESITYLCNKAAGLEKAYHMGASGATPPPEARLP